MRWFVLAAVVGIAACALPEREVLAQEEIPFEEMHPPSSLDGPPSSVIGPGFAPEEIFFGDGTAQEKPGKARVSGSSTKSSATKGSTKGSAAGKKAGSAAPAKKKAGSTPAAGEKDEKGEKEEKEKEEEEEKTVAETLEELAEGEKKLTEGLEEVVKNLRVTTSDEEYKMIIGGAVTADFLWNKRRPVGPGTPFFLAPGSAFGLSQDTFDAHARQTSLYFLFSGPKVCCDWETGGIILVNLYDNSIIQDLYGLLPILAYGQIKNDDWRFAAGLQLDVFNPVNPTVLPFSLLLASGNTGAFRGQARLERFLKLSDLSQITLTTSLGEALPTIVNSAFRTLSEDNGRPNLESRVSYAFGEMEGEGLAAMRPFEVGISGVVGEIRTTSALGQRVVADVRGWGVDGRWEIHKHFGVKGELYSGRTLGTYGTTGMQTINTTTLDGISSRGGWGEVYYYWWRDCGCHCGSLHTHVGYGIDDPTDSDVDNGQILRNQTFFATTLWDVTKALRVGFEVAHRSTAYKFLRDNEGIGFQTQVQWKF